MKYLVLVGDGMADYPIGDLKGKTPLMVARTPHLDRIARRGEMGLVRTVPDGFTPGSEIANLSIFGYDPRLYYRGRGPLEAASLGVKLDRDDLAFRCNLVTLGKDGALMEDFAAGHIGNSEAEQIILDIDRALGGPEVRFYAGVSYRHLMVLREGAARFSNLETLKLTPPHDITGQEIEPFLPRVGSSDSTGAREILRLMRESQRFLEGHAVNLGRKARGLRPANSIWLWGQGRSPQMVTFRERFGIEGYVISAVHLLKGIGILAGLDPLEVPGATGYFDTNYEGKVQYALRGLQERDFVYVHVEAPDEAGHMGDLRLKIEAIEAFDKRIVGPMLIGLKEFDRYRVLALPDHPTPLSLRTHAADPVPFVIFSGEDESGPDRGGGFDEVSAEQRNLLVDRGEELIVRFLAPSRSN